MTTETEAQYVQVPATASDRLAHFHALFAEAKATADAATERLDDIKAGIKAELMALAPEQQKIALSGPDGPTLTLSHSQTARFDSTKFKRDDPETYVRYAKFSDSWTLKVAKGGSSE
jgi:hypothetical protein